MLCDGKEEEEAALGHLVPGRYVVLVTPLCFVLASPFYIPLE